MSRDTIAILVVAGLLLLVWLPTLLVALRRTRRKARPRPNDDR